MILLIACICEKNTYYTHTYILYVLYAGWKISLRKKILVDAPWQLMYRRNNSRIEFSLTFIAWVAGVYASADVLGDGAGDRNRQHGKLRLRADRDPSSARRLL